MVYSYNKPLYNTSNEQTTAPHDKDEYLEHNVEEARNKRTSSLRFTQNPVKNKTVKAKLWCLEIYDEGIKISRQNRKMLSEKVECMGGQRAGIYLEEGKETSGMLAIFYLFILGGSHTDVSSMVNCTSVFHACFWIYILWHV